MTISEHGFLRWIAWALFSCNGRIKRFPYAFAFFFLILLMRIYINLATQLIAAYFVQVPAGMELNPEFFAALATSNYVLPFMVPVFYIYVALDIKRLRSIEAPMIPLIACAFAAISCLTPVFFPALGEMAAMTTFAYHAILALIPAKEDRLHPLERKARTWKALAKGDGQPIRLS
ncbi:hypothetical protein LJC59_05725, partial [Desulfovibrio sp. OttesenSCG-928-A18]|nr:hypothetical protein [Desulfovibrio sp. OttesenSCG-928-A18]